MFEIEAHRPITRRLSVNLVRGHNGELLAQHTKLAEALAWVVENGEEECRLTWEGYLLHLKIGRCPWGR